LKLALMVLLCCVVAAGTGFVLRQPHSSPYMRGEKLAHELGCAGCHETRTDSGIVANPGSLRGVIPSFHSGQAASLFWVQDINDFREWVTNGSSRRADDEKKKFPVAASPSVIRMPPFGNRLSEGNIADLYTYYSRSNTFSPPQSGAAAQGFRLASEQGCFACHGEYGMSGIDNPGSFKGYIPPWEGEDFHELARNDDDIREWIQTGSLARIAHNPLGNYFMSRQKIHMPSYRGKMTEEGINDLVAYIHALSDKSKPVVAASESVASPPDHFSRGELLFRNAGCVTCHKPEGVEGFTDRHGQDIPPQSRVAYRLKIVTRMLQEREGQTQQPSDLCQWYKKFVDEYHDTENIIENGRDDAQVHSDYQDTQHLTPMPMWNERANRDDSSDAVADIDGIIDYLLMKGDATIQQQNIDKWKQSASTCTGLHPAESKKDYEVTRQQIQDRIEVLDKQQKVFDNLPLVTFFSDEIHLVDQVGYFKDGNIDFWLLRQASNTPDMPKVLQEGHFTNRIKFIIAMDKSDVNDYSAYYFTTRDVKNPPNYVSEKFTQAPLVDCFICHASGPRVIRPAIEPDIPALVDRDWSMIRLFNRDIEGYGDVNTPWPPDEKPLESGWMETVTMPACQQCHDSHSLRAPLRRYHFRSIKALIDTYEQDDGYFVKRPTGQLAVMPPMLPLTDAGQLDLLDWTHLSERKRKRPRNQPHS
jgi:cytochrome c553